MVSRTRKRRAYHHGDLERALIDASLQVIARVGPEDFTLRDIARRVGVAPSAPYRHFPDKEALLAELIRKKFALFTERAREAVQQKGEPFEVLAGLLRENLEHAASDAATQYALMAAPDRVWEQTAPEREELAKLAGELIARAQRAGTMRADVGVEDIPMLMCGVSATMAQPGFDWRRHFELLLNGLRA
jgi:AcrR family transcriptional regulator